MRHIEWLKRCNTPWRPQDRAAPVASPSVLLCNRNISLRLLYRLALHNRISVFRAERGLSRKELAEAVGVNPQTIGFLERGDYKPSLELALKLAGVFGVTVEMLFSLKRFEPIALTLKRAGEND